MLVFITHWYNIHIVQTIIVKKEYKYMKVRNKLRNRRGHRTHKIGKMLSVCFVLRCQLVSGSVCKKSFTISHSF